MTRDEGLRARPSRAAGREGLRVDPGRPGRRRPPSSLSTCPGSAPRRSGAPSSVLAAVLAPRSAQGAPGAPSSPRCWHALAGSGLTLPRLSPRCASARHPLKRSRRSRARGLTLCRREVEPSSETLLPARAIDSKRRPTRGSSRSSSAGKPTPAFIQAGQARRRPPVQAGLEPTRRLDQAEQKHEALLDMLEKSFGCTELDRARLAWMHRPVSSRSSFLAASAPSSASSHVLENPREDIDPWYYRRIVGLGVSCRSDRSAESPQALRGDGPRPKPPKHGEHLDNLVRPAE